MKTPPHAPNCPLVVFENGEPVVIHKDRPMTMLPEIVTALEYKAWMMEANKLMKKCMDEGRFHDRYGIEDEPENEQYEKYCDNAGKWLIWEKEV